jgi:surface carbohydrate biosynthesis protein (TIGR04326 family)
LGPDSRVLCWQSYVHGGAVESVPRYLEQHADTIRARYLGFIHAVGEFRVGDRRIVDHLDLGDGASLWWMTLVAEKNPLKSQRVYDCLRLIALEEMLADKSLSELLLVSPSKTLAASIRGLCDFRAVTFRWQRCPPVTPPGRLRTLYGCLPTALQGILSLRHVVTRWPMRALSRTPWFAGSDVVFFCSYFIHLDPTRGPRGQFHSRHWEKLPERLHRSGRRSNWLQLFLLSSVVPDVGTGLRWAQAFNRDSANQGHHVFLESFLSWRTLLQALRKWWRLGRARRRMIGVPEAFQLNGSGLSLWPILRDDWLASLDGPAGMSNCVHLALFDAILAAVPRQRIGLYLFENQPWEVALLTAWRRHGHGRVVGVQHSTTPFWYLPHSTDSRRAGRDAAPLPDRVAVNGAAARDELIAAGFPAALLEDVEALRYLELAGLAEWRQSAPRRPRPAPGSDAALRVLVLGEIAPDSMAQLLRMLDEAFPELPPRFTFTFKPHPSHAVRLADFPRLSVRETDQALHSLLGDHDIAIAGNSTSAAVDAFVAGLPVIVGLHGAHLNLSPLRGRAGVAFVSSGRELRDALLAMPAKDGANPEREQFFFLDPRLPRWERLLDAVREC